MDGKDQADFAVLLIDVFDRLQKLAFEQHPLQDDLVSMPQLTLLNWIAQSPGVGIQQIAEGLGLSSPTVSVSVSRLESAGLLTRQPDPEDGRAVKIDLTEQGLDLHRRAFNFRRNKMRRLLQGLDTGERRVLLDLLEKALSAGESKSEA